MYGVVFGVVEEPYSTVLDVVDWLAVYSGVDPVLGDSSSSVAEIVEVLAKLPSTETGISAVIGDSSSSVAGIVVGIAELYTTVDEIDGTSGVDPVPSVTSENS